MTSILLSNVFNDPSSPWYYVIGVLFLILIFGALAVYIILSGKKKKKDGEPDADSQKTQEPSADTPADAEDQKAEDAEDADRASADGETDIKND